MIKCKTLDNVTYKDKWYRIGSPIDVDDKDIEKLIRIGAVVNLEIIPKKKTKVKVNVIKNPIKIQTRIDKVFDNIDEEIPIIEKLDKKKTKDFIEKEIIPVVKRKKLEKKSFRKRRR